MAIDRSKRVTFDEVADTYDEVAASYPGELVSDIIALSRIPAQGRILEIGCGSGNATLPFARRGYSIIAIELGEHLAALAAKNCAAYPNVQVLNTAFEDWPFEENAFDLALAADAMHWIPPEIGFPRAAKALKPGGYAAFFWQVPVDPDTTLSEAIDRLYQAYPEFVNPDKRFTAEWLKSTISENFRLSGCFGEVTTRQYFWDETETAEQRIQGLRTFSMHQWIDEAKRAELYRKIRDTIEDSGGTITQPCSVMLFVSKVRK